MSDRHEAAPRRSEGALSRTFRGLVFGLAAIATCVWFIPAMPAGNLDPSWAMGLNQAVAQHLAFGDAFIFSFGPYVSLYTQYYHPETAALTVLGNLTLALSLWVALVMVAAPRRLMALVVAVALIAFRYSRDVQLFLPALLAGLVTYQLVSRPRDVRRMLTTRVGLIIVFVPLGLIPLVKGSALVLVIGVLALSVSVFVVYGEFVLAAIAACVPLVSSVVFWRLAGQPLSALPMYAGSITAMSATYAEAMALDGPRRQIEWFLAASAAFAVIPLLERGAAWRARLFLFALLGVYLFIAFKAGFVRHDDHALAAADALAVAGFILLLFSRSAARFIVLGVSVLAWSQITALATAPPTRSTVEMLTSAYDAARSGIPRYLADADWPRAGYEAAMTRLKTESGLPELTGTADIYSAQQAYLLASRARWSPRPVFQSYAAYTPALAARNRDHLLGPAAPDHVVFRVEPIDFRLPSSEDGPSWPVLLSRYQPVEYGNDFLVLDRRPAAQPVTIGNAMPSTSHQFGETVAVPGSDAPLFAQFDVRPNVLGRIAGFFYKPSRLDIDLELSTGEHRSYRFVPGLGAAGFVLSPVVESTAEFAMLFADPSLLQNKRVTAFSVGPKGHRSRLWQNDYTVTLRPLSDLSPVDVTPVLKFTRFETPALPVAATAEPCGGFIDYINGRAPQSGNLGRLLRVNGWLAVSTAEGIIGDGTYVVLIDATGRQLFARADQTARPDVAAFLKQPALERAGFRLVADLSGLPGAYTLGMAIAHDGHLAVCEQPRLSVTVEP